MESLPVEVVGNILSHISAAKDVISAAATCRKWLAAFCRHVSTLTFHVDDYPTFRDLSSTRLEMLITKTVFQMTGIQRLSVAMDNLVSISVSPVLAWLLYTRETLKFISLRVQICPLISILDLCGLHRLETLILAHNSIIGPAAHLKFPCLKSLSLTDVSISENDLSLLVRSCVKLESLELISLQFSPRVSLELINHSLTNILVQGFALDKFTLEAESLEILRLKELTMHVMLVSGKGLLRWLRFDDVSMLHFELGHLSQLEVVEIHDYIVSWPELLQMISSSSRLRRLKLWGVVFDIEAEKDKEVEAIATFFPELRELILGFEERGYTGDWLLGELTVLEVCWTVPYEPTLRWFDNLMSRCPELKKLVIHGPVSEVKSHEDRVALAEFMTMIVTLTRKYLDVEVQFEFH